MYPERSIWTQSTTLDAYHGEWTDTLRQMLKDCGCKTMIPVKIYSFYDGSIRAKYRIVIQLPMELGLSMAMSSGEARTQMSAFQIAVVAAVTMIRQYKAKELRGTTFLPIPHSGEKDEPMTDHYRLAKKDPAAVARYMDRCRALLSSFYGTHQTLVSELGVALEDFTDPHKAQELRRKLAQEGKNPQPIPTVTAAYEEEPIPKTPTYYPYSSDRYEAEKEVCDMSDSEVPIENSTGWRWGDDTYSGNPSGYDGGDEVTSQFHTAYHTTEVGAGSRNPGEYEKNLTQ